MAFWGVEVKPGKPYTHSRDGNRGVLRLSQVTLGDGTAIKRTVLQCNVGNKSPVLLCSLLPDRAESCCVDLQFGESEEVIFSVVGPRSIHLAGYFISGSSRSLNGNPNDSDSYGEDIWETGSEKSGSYGSEDEDKYESDFIDDGNIEMSSSPPCSSRVVTEEIMEDEKPVDEIHTHRRLRKKHQISDSDEGDVGQCEIVKHSKSPVFESEEEEDGFPISFSMGNKDKKNVGGDEKFDGKVLDVDRKRKVDIVVQDKDSESSRKDKVDAVSSGKLKKKKKDKGKLTKSLETDAIAPSEKIRGMPNEDQNKYTDGKRDETQPCEGEKAKVSQEDHAYEMVVTESSGKLKKKKKEKGRRGATHETRVDLAVDKFDGGANSDQIEAANDIQETNIQNSNKGLQDKSGHPDVSDWKGIGGSSDKLKRKRKISKDTNIFHEDNRSADTLTREGNAESQSMEAIKDKTSKSQEKMCEDQPVGEPSFEMAGVDEGAIPEDICHESNKKKQKKKKKKNR